MMMMKKETKLDLNHNFVSKNDNANKKHMDIIVSIINNNISGKKEEKEKNKSKYFNEEEEGKKLVIDIQKKDSNTNSNSTETIKTNNKFKCSYEGCEGTFRKKYLLQAHIRSKHTFCVSIPMFNHLI